MTGKVPVISSAMTTNANRVREALNAGNSSKEKGPPVADGVLTVTADTPEVAEWRSRSGMDCAGTSSTYLEDDEDDPKPHELFGKFTWKIDNFSETSKRELRSTVFEVGNYKWYILVYPQGCDVCNHLSLFLCVADYDKLLPGWSHFAQFTIAVVNKDPKKSKYSDTLHRFCKKEHDWGWKKFMELSKVLDGFTMGDTLCIKAQVQVILDKPHRPFRCLDPQYRRELVRVYLTNVEGICRRFCEEKRARLSWIRDEQKKLQEFWSQLTPEQQKKLTMEKGETVLKAVVKQFFNEKEVTSTLVMDALYSGCRQLEQQSAEWLQGKSSDGPPSIILRQKGNILYFGTDISKLCDQIGKEFIPSYSRDDKQLVGGQDGLGLRTAQEGEDYRRDFIDRDEKRLAELGWKTVEMFCISHMVVEKIEVAYREAEALKRQDELIAEEEEAERREEHRNLTRALADKERKAKKKERQKLKKDLERQKREQREAEKKRLEEEKLAESSRKAAEKEKRKLAEGSTNTTTTSGSGTPPQEGSKGKRKKSSVKNDKGDGGSTTSTPRDHPSDDKGDPSERNTQVPSGICVSPSPSATSSDLASGDGVSEDEVQVDTSPLQGARRLSTSPASSRQLPADVLEYQRSLEHEVTTLRERITDLEQQLADKDAEVFALRAQLSELQPTELADIIKEAAAAKAAAAAASSRAGSGIHLANGPSTVAEGTHINDSRQSSCSGSLDDPRPLSKDGSEPTNGPVHGPWGSHREGSEVADGGSLGLKAEGPTENGPRFGEAMIGGPNRRMPPSHLPQALGTSGPQRQPNGLQNGPRGPAGLPSRPQALDVMGNAHPSSGAPPSPMAGTRGVSEGGVMRPGSSAGGGIHGGPHVGHHSTTPPSGSLGPGGRSRSATIIDSAQGPPTAPPSSKPPASHYLPPSSTACVLTQNGIAGVLHSSTPLSEVMPSYRNAAAGMTSSNIAALPGGQGAHQRHQKYNDDIALHSQMQRAPNQGREEAAPYGGGPHLMMPQQGHPSVGPRSLFGPMAGKRAGNVPHMESPGLDDFAHMGLINDLLTDC